MTVFSLEYFVATHFPYQRLPYWLEAASLEKMIFTHLNTKLLLHIGEMKKIFFFQKVPSSKASSSTSVHKVTG